METVSFYTLVCVTVGVILWELRRETAFLKLPFLFGVVYLMWVIPQLSAIRRTYLTPTDDLLNLHLMCVLCLVVTVLGWHRGVCSAPRKAHPQIAEEYAVIPATVIVTFVAMFATMTIAVLPLEERSMNMPSGRMTILLFIANLKIISLILSLTIFIRSHSPFNAMLLSINILLYLPAILLYFRRAELIELVLAILLVVWFSCRRTPPRIVLLGGVAVVTIFVSAAGHLRTLAQEEGHGEWRTLNFQQIAKIDYLSALPFVRTDSAQELLNALNLIRLADSANYFTYGTELWNRLVFQFVPAQYVGEGFKNSLMFDTAYKYLMQSQVNHFVATGSTYTGMGIGYVEFWFFGAIYFLVSAFILGRVWQSALRGNLWSQSYYVAGLVPALHAITHGPHIFMNSMITYAIVIGGMRKLFRGSGRSSSNRFFASRSRPVPQDSRLLRLPR